MLKNNKAVDSIALEKDIQTAESINAYFMLKDDLKKYEVKVFVVNSIEDFLAEGENAKILSNEFNSTN